MVKFRRQQIHTKRKLRRKGWHRPRGVDSKQKIGKRYAGKKPTIGYKKGKGRAMHPAGLKEVLVHNLTELEKLDLKKHAVRIAKIGKLKAMRVTEEAKKRGLKILNPRAGEIKGKK